MHEASKALGRASCCDVIGQDTHARFPRRMNETTQPRTDLELGVCGRKKVASTLLAPPRAAVITRSLLSVRRVTDTRAPLASFTFFPFGVLRYRPHDVPHAFITEPWPRLDNHRSFSQIALFAEHRQTNEKRDTKFRSKTRPIFPFPLFFISIDCE